MSEQAVKPAVTAAFPPPPPFWKHFTRENIDKFEEFKAERAAATAEGRDDGAEDNVDIGNASRQAGEDEKRQKKKQQIKNRKIDYDRLRKEVPFELRYLVPPAIPRDTYELFGELQQVSMTLPSLTSQGINQVFPEAPTTTTTTTTTITTATETAGTASAAAGPAPPASTASPAKDSNNNSNSSSNNDNLPPNPQFWLRTISKYLLLNFLELSGLLASIPSAARDKIEDIRNLFINAHHLLNMYRPHQARETVILMLEEQIKKSREEIEEMERVKGKVEGVLRRLEEEGKGVQGGSWSGSGNGKGGEVGKKAKREVSSDDGLFEDEEEDEEEEDVMHLGRDGGNDGDDRIGKRNAGMRGIEEWKEIWEVLGSG